MSEGSILSSGTKNLLMNIEETNKLIAEFMGFTEQKDPTLPRFGQWIASSNNVWSSRVERLQFNTSWDWLFKVVEKIEKLSYRKGRKFFLLKECAYVQIKIDRMNYQIFSKWGIGDGDILLGVYKAVIQFIEWYNIQNKIRNHGREI